MTELVFSYLAGLLTTLNPCVLPMIPLVLAGTLKGGTLGPPVFAGGMVASFTLLGLFVASIGVGLDIDGHFLRGVAAALAIVMGLVLIVEPLQVRFATATAGFADSANLLADRANIGGLAGPFLIGALAGAIWSPCSGPSLGVAMALAMEATALGEAALRMAVFGFGAATILMGLAYGSRAAIASRREWMMAVAARLKPFAGAAFLIVGLLVLTGWDRSLEAALVEISPDWLIRLTTSY